MDPYSSSDEESVIGYASLDSSSQPSLSTVDVEPLLEYPTGNAIIPTEWITVLTQFVRSFTDRYCLVLQEILEEYDKLGCSHYVYYKRLLSSREEICFSYRTFVSKREITKSSLLECPAFKINIRRDVKNMVAPKNKNRRTMFRKFKDSACGLASDVERCRAIINDILCEREQISACPPPKNSQTDVLVDGWGSILAEETATQENWETLKEGLAIGRFLHFTGAVWTCDVTECIEDPIPLFIAQAPVVIPPPVWCPVTTIVHLRQPPPDPLTSRIDPIKPLGESTALKAFEAFPGAIALMKFIDGTFVIVYPQDTDCADLMDMVPTTFGGLAVDLTTDKIAPCTDGMPAEPVEESGPQSGSDKIELYPGRPLIVRGLLHDQEPIRHRKASAKAARLLPYIYDSTQASAGVLLDSGGGEVVLTTVSHLPLLHQRYTRKAIKELSLKLQRPETALGMEVYTNDFNFPVAQVSKIFDDEQTTKDYPKGYTFDLAFLKILGPQTGTYSKRRNFRPKRSPLQYNELLRLVPGMGDTIEGRSFPYRFGAIIGEAFVKANVRYIKDLADSDKKSISSAEKASLDLKAQLSHCTLWRMAGPYQSLGTLSGSPVEVVSTGEILGFQCWEWVKRRGTPPMWARDADGLAHDDEDAVSAKTLAMRYPFYGIYDLPDEVERMPIMELSA